MANLFIELPRKSGSLLAYQRVLNGGLSYKYETGAEARSPTKSLRSRLMGDNQYCTVGDSVQISRWTEINAFSQHRTSSRVIRCAAERRPGSSSK
jgi:hypothetical protein